MWLTASAVSYSAARLARRVRSQSVAGRGGAREDLAADVRRDRADDGRRDGLGRGSVVKPDALGQFVARVAASVRPAVYIRTDWPTVMVSPLRSGAS